MADLPSTQEPGEPLVYRPISGLALVGFVLGALFAGVVLLIATIALVQGMPVFLPGFTLGLPVAAAIICFLAWIRIRNAEGTLAGLALTQWGLWLSLLFGVTYFVYTRVAGEVLKKQADAFLRVKSDEDSGFFPRLMNAGKNRTELYQAFLLSLPTTSRGGSKAANEKAMLLQFDQPGKDGEPGNISKFSKNPLVLALAKDPETIIEPLGVLEWKFEGNSYHVVRNYRFTTKELKIETPIPVQSTEASGPGEQRKWFVAIINMPRLASLQYTPLGEKLYSLRRDSKGFLEQWRLDLSSATPSPIYKETDTDWTKILPEKALQGEHVKTTLGEIFRGERKAPAQMMLLSDDNFGDWSAADGRIQIIHPLRMMLPSTERFPPFAVDLDVVVATKQPVDLAAPVANPPNWNWEIRKILVQRAAVADKGMGPP